MFGKSSFINRVAKNSRLEVGNKPGVTKRKQWIRVNEKIELLDTPGVLWPKFESEEIAFKLASMTIIKEEVLPLDEVCIYILETLNKYYKEILISTFGLDNFDINEVYEVYEIIGKFKNFPKVGGEPDFDRINKYIINSIKNGTLKGITFDKCN